MIDIRDMVTVNELKSLEARFLKSVISKLGICLYSPEESILHQGDEGQEMFFILQGDCVVTMVDYDGYDQMIGIMVSGEHFGELSHVFKCPVTCTVLSRNYNSMARLDHYFLRYILSEYPLYNDIIRKRAYQYRDPKID